MIARERNGARKKGNEDGRIKGDWRRKRRVSRGSRCKRGGKVDADKYARHEGSSSRVVRAFLLYPCARSRAINPRDG